MLDFGPHDKSLFRDTNPSRSVFSRMRDAHRDFFYGESGLLRTGTPKSLLEQDLEALATNTFSAFEKDYSGLLGDSNSTLKRIHNTLFSGSGLEDELSPVNRAKGINDHLYDYGVSERGGYQGLSLPGENDDAFSYSIKGARNTIINRLLDLGPSRDTTAEIMKGHTERLKTMAWDGYVSRPGVGPVLQAILGAQKEITIDIFQLQNKTIGDALFYAAAEQGVTLNVRVAMPGRGLNSERDVTGFNILGPNLLQLQRLYSLGQSLPEGQVNLFVADKKSHPKVLITDQEAIIGTLNFTSPVGSQVSQAGSNYEAIRILKRGGYTAGELGRSGSEINQQSLTNSTAAERSARLYYQLAEVVNATTISDPTVQMRTGQGNIVAPGEIAEELRRSIKMVKGKWDSQFHAILNQPFLMQLDPSLHESVMQGEMGKWGFTQGDREFNATRVGGALSKTYRGIQRDLFDLLIEGQAFVSVDNRGYTEHVVEPMYERVKGLLDRSKGEGAFEALGGSLEALARLGGTGSKQQRISKLANELGADLDVARQVLAMTSGNVRLTTATMQHVKSFMVTEGSGEGARATSYYMGSSNLGPYSLHFQGGDPNLVNRELGLMFSTHRARQMGQFALSRGEEQAELGTALDTFRDQWYSLVGGQLGGASNTAAWYEDKVSNKGLVELATRLRGLSKDAGQGITVNWVYGGKSGTERTAIDVSVDVRKLAGFTGGLDSLQGEGPTFNMRYTVLSEGLNSEAGYVLSVDTGKVISRSLLMNMGTPSTKVSSEIRSPIDTTVAMVASLATESLSRVLDWGPKQFIQDLDVNQQMDRVLDYTDFHISGRRGSSIGMPGYYTLNADAKDLMNLSQLLQRRFQGNTQRDDAIAKVQAFKGSSEHGVSQTVIDQTTNILEVMASTPLSARSRDWGALTSAKGGIANLLVNLMHESPEFLLDVVQTTKDNRYDKAIREGLEEYRTGLMEPYLYYSDVASYTGSQGINRLPIYQNSEAMRVRARGTSEGMANLINQSRMVPASYNPTSDIGLPGAGRSIASKSTINETNGIGSTLYGVGDSKVGDVADPSLAMEMGVAYTSNIHDLIGLVDSNEKTSALINDRFMGADEVLGYTFGTRSKISNIPQRLKNVIGQRSLIPMTEMAKQMLQAERTYNMTGHRGTMADLKGDYLELRALQKLSSASLSGYAEAYLEVLREEVTSRYGARVADILVEKDMKLAALYGGGLRKVMGRAQIGEIDNYQQYVRDTIEIYGKEGLKTIDFDRDSSRDGSEIGYYLLRAKAVVADMRPGGMKGFTGGIVENPLVLMQLGGAFSDSMQANPMYGGGIREGFIETKTERVRASRLGTDVEMVAKVGDMVTFDANRNQVIVLRDNQVKSRMTVGQHISVEQAQRLMRAVDDRGQVAILRGIIDKVQRGQSKGTATLEVSSYASSRAGEDAIDYLLEAKQLVGSAKTNTMYYEFTYASSILPNGGRRIEAGASGGLGKAVVSFSTKEAFQSWLDTKVESYKSRGIESSLSGEGIGVERVFGMLNPNNLKSFFYSHGAGIAQDRVKLERLLGSKTSGQVAATLLLHFGSAWASNEYDSRIGNELANFLRRGELGDYYQTLASTMTLQGEDVGARLTGVTGSGTDNDPYRTNKDRYNITQLPELSNISADEVLSALQGQDQGGLAKRVRSMIGGLSEARSGLREDIGPMDLASAKDRQSAILLTALDMTAQLSGQSRHGGLIDPMDMYVGDDQHGNRNLLKVGSIMEFDVLRLQRGLHGDSLGNFHAEDRKYVEWVRSVVGGMTGSVASVLLDIDISFSKSKEPTGKKMTGNIEGVQMVKPFLQLAEQFREGGSVNKLRTVVATLLTGLGVGESAMALGDELSLGASKSILDLGLQSATHKASYLGMYASGLESSTSADREYMKYAVGVEKAIQQRLKLVSRISTRIDSEDISHSRRLELERTKTSLISQAYQLMVYGDDPGNLIGQSNSLKAVASPYSEVLGHIKEIAQRYDDLSTKAWGTELGTHIANNMRHRGGIYSMPAVRLDRVVEEGAVYKMDAGHLEHSYIFGGEELATLGQQYGSHLDKLVEATLTITSAFTPGTRMSRVLQKMVEAKIGGRGEFVLSAEEAADLETFRYTFSKMPGMIAEKGTGASLQKAMGGKFTSRGKVSTPIGSWQVPEGGILLGTELLRQQGGAGNLERRRELADTFAQLASLEEDDTDILKGVRQKLLRAKRDTLTYGMSDRGFAMLEKVKADQITLEALHKTGIGYEDASPILEGMRKSYLDQYSRKSRPGDWYAIEVGLTKLEQWKYDFGYIPEEAKLLTPPEVFQVIDSIANQMERAKSGIELPKVSQFQQYIIGLDKPSGTQHLEEVKVVIPQGDDSLDEVISRTNSSTRYRSPNYYDKELAIKVVRAYEQLANAQSQLNRSQHRLAQASISEWDIDERYYEGYTSVKEAKQTIRKAERAYQRAIKARDRLGGAYDRSKVLDYGRDNTSESEAILEAFQKGSRAGDGLEQGRLLSSQIAIDPEITQAYNEYQFSEGILRQLQSEHGEALTSLESLNRRLRQLNEGIFERPTKAQTHKPIEVELNTLTRPVLKGRDADGNLLKPLLRSNDRTLQALEEGEAPTQRSIDPEALEQRKGISRAIAQQKESLSIRRAILEEREKGITSREQRALQELEDYRAISTHDIEGRLHEVIAREAQARQTLRQAEVIHSQIESTWHGAIETHHRRVIQAEDDLQQARRTLDDSRTYLKAALDASKASLDNHVYGLREKELEASQRLFDEALESSKSALEHWEDSGHNAIRSRSLEAQQYKASLKELTDNLFIPDETTKGSFRAYTVQDSIFRGLTDAQAIEVMTGKIDRLQAGYERINEHLEAMGNQEGFDNQLNAESRLKLQGLIESMGAYKAEVKGVRSARAIAHKINQLVLTTDTTDLMQTITFRNAPFGSTETQRQALSVIDGLGILNEYISSKGGKGGFDTSRNSTLTVLNPISRLTMNLGDFDGDPYTSIFVSLADTHHEIEQVEDRIKNLEYRKVNLNKVMESGHMEEESYLSQALELDQGIAELKQTVGQHVQRVSDTYSMLENNAGGSIRKEVANYLGLNKSFFMGGGEGYQQDTIHAGLMGTFLQQGHGLFPGLKGKGNAITNLDHILGGLTEAVVNGASIKDVESVQALSAALDTLRGMDEESFRASEVGSRIRSSLHSRGRVEVYETLAKDAQSREWVADEVKAIVSDAFSRSVDIGEHDPNLELTRAIGRGVGRLTMMEGSHKESVDFMTKAMGANMHVGVYDMLTKVLGKSGGDILGKTYNTLVGTLFMDSPMIAISSALTESGPGSDIWSSTHSLVKQHYSGDQFYMTAEGGLQGGEAADRFMSDLRQERERAEGLLGFLKSSQQLLRDAIKFKKGDGTMAMLQSEMERYEKAEEGSTEQKAIISKMAGALGPGPGLKAFMQLDALIGYRGERVFDRKLLDISDLTKEGLGKLPQDLSASFGIDSIDQLHSLAKDLRTSQRAYGLEESYNPSIRELVSYQTTTNLQNLVAAFRYDLAKDAGDGLGGIVKQGMKAFMQHLGYSEEVSSKEGAVRYAFGLEGEDSDIAQVRRSRAQAIMGSDYKGDKTSEANLNRALAVIDETMGQTRQAFGEVGQGMSRFTQLSHMSKAMRAVGRGDDLKIDPYGSGVMEGDVLRSMLDLAVANKLTPDASFKYMQILQQHIAEGRPVGGFDVMHLAGGVDNEVTKTLGILRQAKGQIRVGEGLYEGIPDYLSKRLESTTSGQRSAMLNDVVNAFKIHYGQGKEEDVIKSLLSSQMSPEEATRVSSSLHGEFAKEALRRSTTASEPSNSMHAHLRESINNKVQYAASQRVEKAASQLHNTLDIGLGVGLGTLSSALTGHADAGQIISGAIASLGYNKATMTTGALGGALAGVGSLFRVRMAQQGGGEEWIKDWLVRESIMFGGATLLGPVAHAAANKMMLAGAELMGARIKPMDVDHMAGWKGGASTIAGALISSVMGSATATILEAPMENLIPSIGALGEVIHGIRESAMQQDNQRLITMAEGIDIEAEDDPLAEAIQVSYELSDAMDMKHVYEALGEGEDLSANGNEGVEYTMAA